MRGGLRGKGGGSSSLSRQSPEGVGCGLWVVGCGLWVAGCGLWVVVCGLWVVGCGLWFVGCGLLGSCGVGCWVLEQVVGFELCGACFGAGCGV